MFFRAHKQIGICVTPQRLAIAEYDKKSRKLKYKGDFSLDDQASWVAAVKDRLQFHKNDRAMISVPAINVLKKIIYIHRGCSMDDIAIHVKYEGEKYFPEIKEALCFDFHMTLRENQDENEVQLFAVKKEEVERRMLLAKKLKIKLRAVEPDSFSAMRFFLEKGPLKTVSDLPIGFLAKDWNDTWRLIIFSGQEVLSDSVVPQHDFSQRFEQVLQHVSIAGVRIKIKKIYIPTGYKNQFDLLTGDRGESHEVEYVDGLEREIEQIQELHFSAQVALGLAMRSEP